MLKFVGVSMRVMGLSFIKELYKIYLLILCHFIIEITIACGQFAVIEMYDWEAKYDNFLLHPLSH